MRHQRSIKPYAHPIAQVDGTVPVTGGELPVTRETADRLVNPRTRTAKSLNRGKWDYQTYCLVCHGESGRGDDPVSLQGGGPFPGVHSRRWEARRSTPDCSAPAPIAPGGPITRTSSSGRGWRRAW